MAEHLNLGVLEVDDVALLILDHLARADRPGGVLAAVLGAHLTRRINGVAQLGGLLVLAHAAGGGDLHVVGQARGEAEGDPFGHVLVEGDGVGELGRAVRVQDRDLAARGDHAALAVVVHLLGAQHPALVARLHRALGGDGVVGFVLDQLIGFHVEAVAGEAIVRRRRRGLGDSGIVSGRGADGGLGARGALSMHEACSAKGSAGHTRRQAALQRMRRPGADVHHAPTSLRFMPSPDAPARVDPSNQPSSV